MTRIKASKTVYTSRTEFENAINNAAEKQLKLDAEIAAYNATKADEDKAFKNRVKKTKAEIDSIVNAAENYTDHNRETILGTKQTGDTIKAYFGYRRSPGVIKTLNSKWTFAKALEALKASQKTACIKVTETLNKQAVKAQIPEPELPKYGLRLDFPEEFYIEPKRAEETPAKKAVA